ncbi:unnamed protein product [Albugo candida]|uniref:Cyclic nucleotide-binding domain-containing protein n=2 Tax=Albugo candida TaxID=65357 RepID=A0A024GPF7_9STRA|nr:unnamed protein product [Albugo candida]|eukprot:CCI48237.1 unnamed protein product [Albugo candida]
MKPLTRSQYDAETDKKLLQSLIENAKIDTGDIVLFNRPCFQMDLYGGIICTCAKLFGNTDWDHIGVIVRVPASAESEKNVSELHLLEATLSGVKLRPLEDRILRSRANEISIRRLQVHRTSEFQKAAHQFVQLVQDSKYEDRLERFVNAGYQRRTRMQHEALFNELVNLKKAIKQFQCEMDHRSNMTLFERNNLSKEMQSTQMKAQEIMQRLETLYPHKNSRKESEEAISPIEHHHKVFCSQLIAALYQHLGILLPYPSAHLYAPKHFSSTDESHYVKLQQTTTLLPELSFRQELRSNAIAYQRREQSCVASSQKNTDLLASEVILYALKRHPLFHNRDIMELQQLVKKFRRVELDPGEVVFYQGMEGDGFYIIEEGECEVLVNYRDSALQKLEDGSTDEESQSQRHLEQNTVLPKELWQSIPLASEPEYVVVGTNGPSSAFGMSALIYNTPRRATVRVMPEMELSTKPAEKKTAVLWKLDKAAFQEAIQAHPSSQYSVQEYRFLMETVSKHPLFESLDARTKALAVRKCFPLNYLAGSRILQQGDVGDYFYLIENGECLVTRSKPPQLFQAQTLIDQNDDRAASTAASFVDSTLKRGSTFGEAALLYNSRRGATVTALQDTKVWCMDRASFVTITRSGSASLYELFKRASSIRRPTTSEASKTSNQSLTSQREEHFMIRADLERLLTSWPATTSEYETLENRKENLIDEANCDKERNKRAIQLALALLLRDSSGLVNFSQFAHFHIALSSAQVDQLLPEAAFRALHSSSQDLDTGAYPTGGSHCNVKLKDLTKAMMIWQRAGCQQSGNSLTDSARLSFYRDLFSLNFPAETEVAMASLGNHYVTYEDLVRGITRILHEQSQSRSRNKNLGISEARKEFLAFLDTLQSDLIDLRQLWNVVQIQKLPHRHQYSSTGAQNSTIKAKVSKMLHDFETGWSLTSRHSPSGTDWEYLKPALEKDEDETGIMRLQRTQALSCFLGIAGAIFAGIVARTICAPLDRLKILKQISTLRGAASSLHYDFAQRGIVRGLLQVYRLNRWRGLFAGNLTHCLWLLPALPMKLFLTSTMYDTLGQRIIPVLSSRNGDKQISSHEQFISFIGLDTNFLACGLIGIIVNTLCLPLDTLRTRMSVQSSSMTPIKKIVKSLYAKENFRGFFHGSTASNLGAFVYFGSYYVTYEFWRPVFLQYHNDISQGKDPTDEPENRPNGRGQILCAMTAAVVAQAYAYPFDLMRRRLQVAGNWHPETNFPQYRSTWNCFLKSIDTSSNAVKPGDQTSQRWKIRWNPFNLYRGFVVNTIRVVPSVGISLWTYETFQKWMRRES